MSIVCLAVPEWRTTKKHTNMSTAKVPTRTMKDKADVSNTDLVLEVQQCSTKTGITHYQMLVKIIYSN